MEVSMPVKVLKYSVVYSQDLLNKRLQKFLHNGIYNYILWTPFNNYKKVRKNILKKFCECTPMSQIPSNIHN